jgi:hypothetical protein
MQKMANYGVFYFIIAVLFAIGAMYKTISSDLVVIEMQWFCALVFAVVGILRFSKRKGKG